MFSLSYNILCLSTHKNVWLFALECITNVFLNIGTNVLLRLDKRKSFCGEYKIIIKYIDVYNNRSVSIKW